MDPRQRRQTTARTARLGFLLIGNLAAILFLLNHFLGGEPGQASAAGNVAAAPAEDTQPDDRAPNRLPGRDSLALDSGAPSRAHLAASGTERSAAPPSTLDVELSRRIEGHIDAAIAKAAKLSKGRAQDSNCLVSLSVLGPDGMRLVDRFSERSMRPASNMKLVTSAAALLQMGKEGSFNTRFETNGRVSGGVLEGDLIVRAGGDPFFDPLADGRVGHLLAPVIEALRAAGIQQIQGQLVLDAGDFADPGPAPGWPSADQYWQEHCALAAGFSANAGCLTAYVVPTSVGAQAIAELRPDLGGLERSGTVKTGSPKSRLDIAVGANKYKATLRGSIPMSPGPWTQRFSHPDPVGLFGAVLQRALGEAGIRVQGSVRLERGAPAGAELFTLRTPISTVLEPINAESNNAVADQLFLALGHQVTGQGTRHGGELAAKRALESLGVSASGLAMADGSGLSRDNHVTPQQLTGLLSSVANHGGAIWKLYLNSLAVAGVKGSLENRMRNTPAEARVFAKTGWINGTSSLSGYVELNDGERLCFSLLVSYPNVSGLNTKCWKPLGDDICIELAKWKSKQNKVR